MRIETSAHILLMAFRYALPRKTGAVSEVVRELSLHWYGLAEWMREQILDDIQRQYRLSESLEYETYDEEWNRILEHEKNHSNEEEI